MAAATAYTVEVLFVLALLARTNGQISINCGPRNEARESQSHNITCDGLDVNSTVQWKFVYGESPPQSLGECNINSCSVADNSRYEIFRAGSQSTVRVRRVTRTGGEVLGQWRCQQNGTQPAQCLVSQIVFPAQVNNNQCIISFNESSKLVNARCVIIKSNPPTSCSWKYYRTGHSLQDVKGSDTSTTFSPYHDSDNGQIYYTGECRIHEMPVPAEEGEYVFRVLILPGGVEPAVSFSTTNVVAHPKLPVLKDCKSDWIDLDRVNAGVVICTCTAPDVGSPPGHLLLRHPNGTDVKSSPTGVIPLHIRDVARVDSEREFPCFVQHHTGMMTVTYTPKLTYGPDRVFINEVDTGDASSIQLTCFAAGTNPQPDITWHYKGDAGKMEIGDTYKDGSFYISTLTLKIDNADRGREVLCDAVNLNRPDSKKWAAPYTIPGGQTGGSQGVDTPHGAIAVCIPLFWLLR